MRPEQEIREQRERLKAIAQQLQGDYRAAIMSDCDSKAEGIRQTLEILKNVHVYLSWVLGEKEELVVSIAYTGVGHTYMGYDIEDERDADC